MDVPQAIRNYIFSSIEEKIDDVFFVQIGAQNGKTWDPIWTYLLKYSWNGIRIEPIPYYFKQLQKNDKRLSGNIIELNIAIDHQNSYRNIYYVNPEVDFDTLIPSMISSFDREFLSDKHNFNDDLIEHKEIETRTINGVLDEYAGQAINVMVVDTEGYDYEVLKSLDFTQHRPQVILYEHKHLSNSDNERLHNLLGDNYDLLPMSGNTFALKSGLFQQHLLQLCEVSFKTFESAEEVNKY